MIGGTSLWIPGCEFHYREKRKPKTGRLPVPKGNDTKVIKRGPHYGAAPSNRVVAAQAKMTTILRELWGSHGLFEGAVRVDLRFVFEPPPSWSKWRREAALDGFIHAKSHSLGDLDQLAKLALDAVEAAGILKDDCLVVKGMREKVYGPAQGIELVFTPRPAEPESRTEYWKLLEDRK